MDVNVFLNWYEALNPLVPWGVFATIAGIALTRILFKPIPPKNK